MRQRRSRLQGEPRPRGVQDGVGRDGAARGGLPGEGPRSAEPRGDRALRRAERGAVVRGVRSGRNVLHRGAVRGPIARVGAVLCGALCRMDEDPWRAPSLDNRVRTRPWDPSALSREVGRDRSRTQREIRRAIRRADVRLPRRGSVAHDSCAGVYAATFISSRSTSYQGRGALAKSTPRRAYGLGPRRRPSRRGRRFQTSA